MAAEKDTSLTNLEFLPIRVNVNGRHFTLGVDVDQLTSAG